MFSIRFKDEATADALVVTHGQRALRQEDILAVLDGEPPAIPLPDNAIWPIGSTQLSKLVVQLEAQAASLVGPNFWYYLIRRRIEKINKEIERLEKQRRALWDEELDIVGH